MSAAEDRPRVSFIDINDARIEDARIILCTRVKSGALHPENSYRVQYTLSDDGEYRTAEVSYAIYCSLKEFERKDE